MGSSRRIHAAVLSFVAGVMPPMPMLGRSLLLDVQVNALGPREPAHEPFSRLVLCLLNGFKDVLAQPFAADGAIVALDISVLLGFTWLDVFEPNSVFLSPCHQGPADIFCGRCRHV